MSASAGRNLCRYCTIPKRRWTLATSVGGGISTIAFIFVGSAQMPLSVAMCPIKGTADSLSLILAALQECGQVVVMIKDRLFFRPTTPNDEKIIRDNFDSL